MSIRQVGLEFYTKGEQDAFSKLKTFKHLHDETSGSIKRGMAATAGMERDIRKLTDAFAKGAVSEKAYNDAMRSIAREYKNLNEGARGMEMSIQKATAAVRGVAKAHQDQAAAAVVAMQKQEELNASKQRAAFVLAMQKQKMDEEVKAQRHADAEAKRHEQTLEQLRYKFVQGYGAMDLYSKELNDLAVARRADIITAEQQKAALDQLNKEYTDFTSGAATANNRFAQHTNQASMRLNQFGVVTQQAGYQVGDFLVQVQSGTNPMVAFGQQATQLVGTFAMLSKTTRGIAIFSGLGIALPLLTAIGAYMMRTKDATDEASDAVKDLESRIKSLDSTVQDWLRTKKAASMGITVEELTGVESIEAAQATLAKAQAEYARVKRLQEASLRAPVGYGGALATMFSSASGDLDVAEAALAKAQETYNNLLEKQAEDRYKIYREEASVMMQGIELERIRASLGSDSIEHMKAESAHRRFNYEQQVKQLDITEEQREALIKTNRELVSSKLANDIDEFIAARNAKIAELGRSIAAPFVERFKEGWKELERVALLETAISVGPSQVEINATNEYVAKMAEAFDNARNLREQLGDAVYEALRFNNVDMSKGVDAATEAAGRLVARMGVSLGLAKELVALGGMSEQEKNIRNRVKAGLAPPEALGDVNLTGGGSTPYALDAYMSQVDARVRAREAAENAARGGGSKKERTTETQFLAALEAELAVKRKMIGASEQERAILERVNELQDQAIQKDLNISESRLRQFVEEELAIQRQLDMQATFSNNIERAMMSVVDGTASVEDAFKSMLRNIIMEIYQQQVAKPIASSIGGWISKLFGSANGNVFAGGSHVTAYANGGVVNGPTFFPMTGNKTGLMGEAGPEAIMPLTRTKNGKLGVVAEGGGGVVVNNHFNIAANGDASVKQIVKGMMPQITAATKSAVADAKRRGGNYGKAFN